MRTVFQLFLLITFVLFSPLLFIVLAFRMGTPTAGALKSQLIKKDIYNSVITEVQKQIDRGVNDASGDDPILLVGPFVKKEFTPAYMREKTEKLIDDTHAWVSGKGESPVVSFRDLKDKLIKQNRNIITELESAMKEMEAAQASAVDQGQDEEAGQMPFSSKDMTKFLSSDFTVPVGTYFGWMKFFSVSLSIAGIVLAACYSLSLFLLLLLSPNLQSRLRWIGWTLFLTVLWNIPGVLVSAGSAVMIAKTFTQSMSGAQYILPVVETFLTPVVVSYAKVATAFSVAGGIFSVGLLVLSLSLSLSLFVTPAEAAAAPAKKKK